MKRAGLAVLAMAAMLGGCGAMQTQVNQQIADSNALRFKAYTDGMVGCKTNESCKLGLSMAFAANMGLQKFEREDSVTDYIKATVPVLGVTLEAIRLFAPGYGGESQGMVVTGSGNTFSGVGNKLVADNQSAVSWTSTTTVDNHRDNYVQRDSRSSSIGQGTVSDVENPVYDHSLAQP